MTKDILEILYDQGKIGKRIRELATQFDIDYQNQSPLVICVLKGATMFFADLTRQRKIPLELGFVAAYSYANRTKSSGKEKITHDVPASIDGRIWGLVSNASGCLFIVKTELSAVSPVSDPVWSSELLAMFLTLENRGGSPIFHLFVPFLSNLEES
jgi:hypothetical protein